MTLAWTIHKGIRMALGNKRDFSFLKRLVTDFGVGVAPLFIHLNADVQSRILARAVAGTSPQAGPTQLGGAGGGQGSGGKQKAGNSPQGPRKKASTDTTIYGDQVEGPAFAKAWAGDMQGMRTAYCCGFRGAIFCGEQSQIEELLGPDFLALVPPGTTPCMSYFLLGRCHDKCTRGHTTTATPSQQVVEGLKARVWAQCQKVIHAKNS
jgi:hypothetical protein